MEIGVIILGFMMCFGERGSDFYGLPWGGRGIHSSTVGLRQERGVRDGREGHRETLFLFLRPLLGVSFSKPQKTKESCKVQPESA